MSTAKPDDLETVRIIVTAVSAFPKEEQERIFRWAAEKLSLTPITSSRAPVAVAPSSAESVNTGAASTPLDIKSFMSEKKPRNDVQFAAATAYFYRFEASAAERKEAITKEDLQEAARKASHERFSNPLNTLNNAHKLGLLDKGSEKATFVINSVGENLVAMTLPDGASVAKTKPRKTAKKVAVKAKKTAKRSNLPATPKKPNR